MTSIRILPLIEVSIVTGTNESFIDAVAFIDAAGNPIPLSGIRFRGQMRPSPTEAACLGFNTADTAPTPGIPNGLLAIGGDGLNVLAFAVPAASMGRLRANTYVFDVVGYAEDVSRRALVGDISLIQGVTR